PGLLLSGAAKAFRPGDARAAGARGRSVVEFLRMRLEALHRLDDLAAGGLRALPAVELDPLALLQVLVVLEEVADALQPVLADLADVLDVGIAGEHLLDRHGQQLGVLAGLVLHLQHADRTAADHRARQQRQRQDHQHVDRVAVAAEGVRHVAVIAGIAHGRGQDAVYEDGADGLVHLVLDRFGVLGDLDDDVDLVRHVATGGNQVQAHGGTPWLALPGGGRIAEKGGARIRERPGARTRNPPRDGLGRRPPKLQNYAVTDPEPPPWPMPSSIPRPSNCCACWTATGQAPSASSCACSCTRPRNW